MKSMLLRGDDMMADPEYKKRMKEFNLSINPKPSEEERKKRLAEIKATQK